MAPAPVARRYGSELEQGHYLIPALTPLLGLPDELPARRYPFPGQSPVAVLGYSREEFLELLRKGNLFLATVMEEGEVCFDDGLLSLARRAFGEARQRWSLRHEDGGWRFNPRG